MVKKSTVIFAILALLAFGACTCWGYTVSQWPVPGISNTFFGHGPAMLGNYQAYPYQAPMYAPGYNYGPPTMYAPRYNYGPPRNFMPYPGPRRY
jgi:hypothetical protein